ncbi:MAG: ribonuclease III [Alphaproteobacteria bacterium]|nr:ribonuclease III [Alphaproteobacteria bacterium]
MIDCGELERAIGYSFVKKEILTRALTHASYTNEHKGFPNNERLEFLGDAVLQYVVTEKLCERFPDADEGVLTRYRSLLVDTERLIYIASQLQIEKYLFLSRGQKLDKKTNGKTLYADAIEALIGALYVDGGSACAKKFITEYIIPFIEDVISGDTKDPKTSLQELTQKLSFGTPEYILEKSAGPDHAKHFEVSVHIQGKKISTGEGNSKQQAEKKAAEQALKEKNWQYIDKKNI